MACSSSSLSPCPEEWCCNTTIPIPVSVEGNCGDCENCCVNGLFGDGKPPHLYAELIGTDDGCSGSFFLNYATIIPIPGFSASGYFYWEFFPAEECPDYCGFPFIGRALIVRCESGIITAKLLLRATNTSAWNCVSTTDLCGKCCTSDNEIYLLGDLSGCTCCEVPIRVTGLCEIAPCCNPLFGNPSVNTVNVTIGGTGPCAGTHTFTLSSPGTYTTPSFTVSCNSIVYTVTGIITCDESLAFPVLKLNITSNGGTTSCNYYANLSGECCDVTTVPGCSSGDNPGAFYCQNYPISIQATISSPGCPELDGRSVTATVNLTDPNADYVWDFAGLFNTTNYKDLDIGGMWGTGTGGPMQLWGTNGCVAMILVGGFQLRPNLDSASAAGGPAISSCNPFTASSLYTTPTAGPCSIQNVNIILAAV